MVNWLNIVRWIHILSGAAWFGEVVAINFVLIPVLLKMEGRARAEFVRQAFPRAFRLASILSLTAIISGAVMSYLITGWKNIGALLGTNWGIGIFGGGVLGLSLMLFHFFVESRLEPVVATADEDNMDQVITVLKLVPRAGMVVIVSIVLLMMYGSRGI